MISEMEIDDLEGGGWIASWEGMGSSGWGIQAQRYDENGIKVGQEINLGQMYDHELMMLGDGGWLLRGGSSGNATLRFDANGYRVDFAEGATKSLHAAAPLAGGGWLSTWTVYDEENHDLTLMQQKFDESGAAIGVGSVVWYESGALARDSTIVMLDDGGWVITWSGNTSFTDIRFYQQRYASDGSVVGDLLRLNSEPDNDYHAPRTALLDDGGWISSWGSDRDILMQRFSATGEKAGDVITIERPAPSNASEEWDIIGLSHGGWALAWSQEDITKPAWETNLMAQAYDADGKAMGRPLIVTQSQTRMVSLAALGDGAFVVSWGDEDSAPATEFKQRLFRSVENTDPIAMDDSAKMTEGQEMSVDVTDNDTDANGDLLTAESVTVVSGDATVTINSNGDLVIKDMSTGLVAGKFATIKIEYTVYDGYGTDTGLLTVKVNGETNNGDEVYGTAKGDDYMGSRADELYFGLGGNDRINGQAGEDFLSGGQGNDTIAGRMGDDIIVGGRGNDILKGDAGQDIFVFNRGDGRDTVYFGIGLAETIDLSDFGFHAVSDVKRLIEYRYSDMIIDLPGKDLITVVDGRLFGAHFLI